jgi:OmpA-OmpF porin, OOP family
MTRPPARVVQTASDMRTSCLSKLIFTLSLSLSASLLSGCSSSAKKPATTPVAAEPAAPPQAEQRYFTEVSKAPPSVRLSDVAPITGDQVFFDVDSAELTAKGKASLDEVVQWVTENEERTILLRGHADPSGEADYNLDLSERRAKAVATYLKSKGVKDNQLILAAAGEQLANKSPDSANRRVIIYSTTVKASMN